MIVPGGGISLDDQRWVSCRSGFFLPVRVLSRLSGDCPGEARRRPPSWPPQLLRPTNIHLADAPILHCLSGPLRKAEWVVYAKPPFGGPESGAGLSVALYPSRCHRHSRFDHSTSRASPSSGRITGSRAAIDTSA